MNSTTTKTENGKLNLSIVQRDILALLRANKGEARVGVIGSNRGNTIRSLEILEKLGLIECVERPVKRATKPVFQIGYSLQPVSDAKCGVWRLTIEGGKVLR
ncbi:MAG: hypothetical protein M3209_09665 [Acidobacteriota bacterium]|nr:hypothetical protein [Acidobacteriota bacterium]